MLRGRMLERGASASSQSSQSSTPKLAGPAVVKMLVGPDSREFILSRKLLASCRYFRQRLDSAPVDFGKGGQPQLVMRLEDQCPDMFELFAYWIDTRRNFDRYIDAAEARRACEELHWDLVNLHLFAAQIDAPALQDCAMDAIQDVYLRRNWDINPRLVAYVYTSCDPQESCRLRKWIVAMTAWTLDGAAAADGMADGIHLLFERCPDFWAEYHTHTRKMARSGLEGHFKNPQLRLPSNHLRNEERQFGFRQCSFHTHRSTVGQGRCPHVVSFSPLVSSPYTDGYVESDSDRAESRFGSRIVSPTSDTIPESDLETP
ncbi:hypothetical protein F4818DRAFT_351172 [Hypoxylon cercidicola]|nr:hypothetical protein F4818DRAFT_351172 [Hypoxylon cercidicola]